MGTLIRRAVISSLTLIFVSVSHAVSFTAISYNVESDPDTDWEIVSKDIIKIGQADIWGLQEVDKSKAVKTFKKAIEQAASNEGENTPDYYYLLGRKGSSDRLAIIYDQNRFKHISVKELIEEVGGSRPPLIARLKDLKTEQEFYFMVNHLQRGDAKIRRKQAKKLNRWVKM